jgi:hypothetical protein
MQTRFLIGSCAAAFVMALAIFPFAGAAAIGHTDPVQSSGAYSHSNSSSSDRVENAVRTGVRLAQTHADICLENEQQCLKGCDGAQSCSDQCGVNYQGCMDQGG